MDIRIICVPCLKADVGMDGLQQPYMGLQYTFVHMHSTWWSLQCLNKHLCDKWASYLTRCKHDNSAVIGRSMRQIQSGTQTVIEMQTQKNSSQTPQILAQMEFMTNLCTRITFSLQHPVTWHWKLGFLKLGGLLHIRSCLYRDTPTPMLRNNSRRVVNLLAVCSWRSFLFSTLLICDKIYNVRYPNYYPNYPPTCNCE